MKHSIYWISLSFIFACNISKTNKKVILPQQTNTDFSALHTEHFDLNTNPADDIYRYVNGSWIDKAEIPEDRGRWGSFDELRKLADYQSFQVLDSAISQKKYAKNSDLYKLIELFTQFQDTIKRNKLGISPIIPQLVKIEGISTIADINKLALSELAYGGNPILGFGVGPDSKNSNRYIVYASAGSIGLPDRDYYFDTTTKGKNIQNQYIIYINKLFNHFYDNSYANVGNEVYAFEKEIAEAKFTKIERRDPNKRYNLMTVAQLQVLFPDFEIAKYLEGFNLKTDTFIVGEPKVLEVIAKYVKENRISALKKYMLWREINSSTSQLDMQLDRLSFEFYGKFLRGTPAQRPLRDRALDAANASLGDALGKLYVANFFSEQAKVSAINLVKNLKVAYAARIKNLDWMSDITKTKAIEKLNAINVKIGFPDKWKDYSKINFEDVNNTASFYDLRKEIGRWSFAQNLADFGNKVDKTRWSMNPQTVNAYYNPVYNEIVFPAAILQYPFFDFRADPAINYGGIGAVIGHEISHGFDDQGAQYDASGNLNNWWTKEDLEKFKTKSQALATQFDKYEALPGKFVNGKFTLGENIGDLGGINAAFDALKLALLNQPKIDLIDGYSQEQRFFMSWNTIWRVKTRDKELENLLLTDPHSPGYFRAIGPPTNMDIFYDLFNVQPTNKLYRKPEDRVKIW